MESGDILTDEERAKAREYGKIQEEKLREFLEKESSSKKEIDVMNTTFEPYEDRVLIYPDPVATKTESGLYLPEEAVKKERPLQGTVVRFGPGKSHNGVVNPLPLTEGMRVVYGKYAGTEFEMNGIVYLIMRMADIFGKV